MSKPRLTKEMVKEAVQQMRFEANRYLLMTPEEIIVAYRERFPVNGTSAPSLSVREMTHTLVMGATYYLTNVLGIE